MRSRRFFALAVVGALFASLMGPVGRAVAQGNTYDVGVGAFFGFPGESMRFLSPELNVHMGDVINFTSESFHTATALPTDVVDVDQWEQDNVVGGGKPWSLFQPDPDEGPTGTKYSNAVLFPPFDCGASPAEACDYDGTGVVNSGALVFSDPDTGYNLEVNAAPGESFWIVCLIHPGMRFKVNVVDDEDTVTTQTEINDFADAAVATDTQDGSALRRSLINRHESRRRGNGTRVWEAWVGYDTENLTLYGMFPQQLNLKKGDKVDYHFDQLSMETHTATMPKKKATNIVRQDFAPVCDPDGDEGTQPDTPATFDDVGNPQCPEGSELEVDAARKLGPPAGDGVVNKLKEFQNSGARGGLPGVFSDYGVTFRAIGNIKYICLIHPFMVGRISVARR